MPVLLGRPDRAMTLLEAVKAGRVLRNEFTPTQVAGLRASRNPARGRSLRQCSSGHRRTIGARSSTVTAPHSICGAMRFAARRHSRRSALPVISRGPTGYAIGPGVEALKVFGKEEALTHVLDPNRTVWTRATACIRSNRGWLEPDRYHPERIGEQRDDPSAVRRQPDSSAVPDRTPAGLERSMMPDGLEEGAVAAGHGGPAPVHRRRPRSER